MIYGSVCSGIEAATVAWHPLGWRPAFFSEIDAFPRAVLAHHYPEVPLHGDFTTIQAGDYRPIDLLVGGTPCQSFSIAGLRGGLADERGNLALEYLRLADRLRPTWLVWENVPGVLSSSGGRDFGAFLGGLVELGYGFAYRVLDAQFFGVAQRRRRVFVVGYLGDWRPAAAVLFEPQSLRGDTAPRRTPGQGTAADAAPSLTAGGRGVERTGESRGQDPVVAVCATGDVFHTLRAEGFDASEDGTGRGCGAIAFHANAQADQLPSESRDTSVTDSLTCSQSAAVATAMQVRRLTPTECERLQGFPDGYTQVPYRNKPAADGPRYKALGNSMAVPVMRWIGQRIQKLESLNDSY